MDTREVSTTVPIEQIPYIMRAIGFYPSEQEVRGSDIIVGSSGGHCIMHIRCVQIEDMLNEVKFSEYVETGKYVTEIDLGDIIKRKPEWTLTRTIWMIISPHFSRAVYINHRPVFGLSPAQLARAFHVLGQRHEGGKEWAMDRGRLLAVLQERGKQVLCDLMQCVCVWRLNQPARKIPLELKELYSIFNLYATSISSGL